MHGTLDKFAWTTERVDLLKTLAAARYSASQIGKELHITRNAVIGKASRIGVELNSTHRSNFKIARPAPQPRPVRTHRFVVKPRVVLPVAEFVPFVPAPLNKTLLELKANDCRFIVTDGSPFLFCGNPKDGSSSYCTHHHFVAVQP